MQKFVIVFLAALSLALVAGVLLRPSQPLPLGMPQVIEGKAGSLLEPAKPMPDFALVDQDGNPFGNAELNGKWTLLFMGFASCGHFCPPTMYKLGLIRDAVMDSTDEKLEVLFVSVDPGRDTLPVLSEYISAYGEGFVAVTGDDAALNQLVGGLGASFRVVQTPDEYTVDHSPAVYLINPEGGFAGLFTPPHRVEPIAGDVVSVIKGL